MKGEETMKISKTASRVLLYGAGGIVLCAAAVWQSAKTDREIEQRLQTTRKLNQELLELNEKAFRKELERIEAME